MSALRKRIPAALLCAALLFAAVACAPAEDPLAPFEGLPTLPLASYYAAEEGAAYAKMKAERSDTYRVSFSQKAVREVACFREEGTLLQKSREPFDLKLEAGQTVFAKFTPVAKSVRVNITPASDMGMPFAVAEAPDPASFETTSADPAFDPLVPAKLTYAKRPGTLYVYSNAPETVRPEALNKCLTRQDVSGKSVFFTFEHQSAALVRAGLSKGVYYGYRVTNTGEEDAYVTVKSVGYQTQGLGDVFGEQEWVDFYGLPLPLRGTEDFTEAQRGTFAAYFQMSGSYVPHDFRPTTYRIPAGKFLYVIGGTTEDAFAGFDVAKTADRATQGIANGAVLFDVVGTAEGAFYVYDDVAAVNKGGSGYDTHLGIIDRNDPAGCVGEEEGAVVDGSATWIFNDATPPQTLPVTFENYYNAALTPLIKDPMFDDLARLPAAQARLLEFFGLDKISPGDPVPGGRDPHVQELRQWATHSDAQHYPDAVGTDITAFRAVLSDGTDHPTATLQYGLYNFSPQCIVPEMGNWMKDYQDLFTFVNQGDTSRTVRIHIVPNGCLSVFFRDAEGSLLWGREKFGLTRPGGPDPFGSGAMLEAIDTAVHEEFSVPPHTVLQIVAEYNLMANSFGNVKHRVELL